MKWISVLDHLPPKDKKVLGLIGSYIGIYCYDGVNEWIDQYHYECSVLVTHWMPLPKLPEV